MNARFEAVYESGDNFRAPEWTVVEWKNEFVGDTLASFSADADGEYAARELAGVLQEAYNMEFFEYFG